MIITLKHYIVLRYMDIFGGKTVIDYYSETFQCMTIVFCLVIRPNFSLQNKKKIMKIRAAVANL